VDDSHDMEEPIGGMIFRELVRRRRYRYRRLVRKEGHNIRVMMMMIVKGHVGW